MVNQRAFSASRAIESKWEELNTNERRRRKKPSTTKTNSDENILTHTHIYMHTQISNGTRKIHVITIHGIECIILYCNMQFSSFLSHHRFCLAAYPSIRERSRKARKKKTHTHIQMHVRFGQQIILESQLYMVLT